MRSRGGPAGTVSLDECDPDARGDVEAQGVEIRGVRIHRAPVPLLGGRQISEIGNHRRDVELVLERVQSRDGQADEDADDDQHHEELD